MANYVKFEFFIPLARSEEDHEAARVRGFLIAEFRKALRARYGGWTGWNPSSAALIGEWVDDGEVVPDQLVPIWVLVEAGRTADEALQSLSDWKELFERHLNERIVLATHYMIQTIGRLDREKSDGQLRLWNRLAEVR
ncbi:hypothetical protein HY634_04430 [Candidatus Uhrbacteria bacterium]|nr:hypothetical protein [Candidatus Uhrbacteria bacterium]